MAQKTEVQYIDRFYVFGSEAPKTAPKPPKPQVKKPAVKLDRPQKVYIDPIALGGMVVAVVMLCLLVAGGIHLSDTRAEYDRAKAQLVALKRQNAQLEHTYHTSYDPEEIRQQAVSQGMIPAEEAERFTAVFYVPQAPEEPTAWERFWYSFAEMFSGTEGLHGE